MPKQMTLEEAVQRMNNLGIKPTTNNIMEFNPIPTKVRVTHYKPDLSFHGMCNAFGAVAATSLTLAAHGTCFYFEADKGNFQFVLSNPDDGHYCTKYYLTLHVAEDSADTTQLTMSVHGEDYILEDRRWDGYDYTTNALDNVWCKMTTAMEMVMYPPTMPEIMLVGETKSGDVAFIYIGGE